jgi:biopolymer transport protein ExbB
MLDLIQKGGPLMLLLVICSVFALTIFIERLIHYYRTRIDVHSFMDSMKDVLQKSHMEDALELCRNAPGPIAHILAVGLMKYDRTRDEIRQSMDEAAVHEVARLEKNLPMLSTIAYISPLIGLLGTVSGMIAAFKMIQDKAASGLVVSPGDLAGGIWEALITTAAGLVVAIPAYVAYNYLVTRVDGMVMEMDENATEMVNLLIAGRNRDAY